MENIIIFFISGEEDEYVGPILGVVRTVSGQPLETINVRHWFIDAACSAERTNFVFTGPSVKRPLIPAFVADESRRRRMGLRFNRREELPRKVGGWQLQVCFCYCSSWNHIGK